MRRVAIGDNVGGIGCGWTVEKRQQVLAVAVDPGADGAGAGDSLETAGLSQDCRREARVHRIELAQERPGRPFADREVRVATGMRPTRGGDRHRGHQSHGDQVEEEVDFLFEEWVFGVITIGDRSGRADRSG